MNNKEKINSYWRSHFRSLGSIGTGIVRRKIQCREITGNEIGYTSKGNSSIATVCLNRSHEAVPKELAKATMFIDGIFCHEIGHQLFSDFIAQENFIEIIEQGSVIPFNNWMSDSSIEGIKLSKAHSKLEVTIYHHIWNAIEDTSIEYWLYNTLGGHFPEALKFAISVTYALTPNIDEIKDPFSQVEAAMINYGDVGLLKGKFTSNEARSYFYKILPIYDEAIYEPNAKRRLALSYVVFDMLRPLWEPIVQQQEKMEQFLKELSKMMKDLHEQSSGSGKGTYSTDAAKAGNGSEEDSDINSKTEQRRKRTIELTKKELKELLENSSNSEGIGQGEEVEIKIIDENTDEDGEGESNSPSEKDTSPNDDSSNNSGSSGSQQSAKTDESDANGDDTSSNGNSDEGENGSENNEKGSNNSSDPAGNSENGGETDGDSHNKGKQDKSDSENGHQYDDPDNLELEQYDDFDIDLSKDYEEVWEETQISQERIDKINKQIEKELNDENLRVIKESNDTDVPDFDDIVGRGFTKASCKNVLVAGSEGVAESYNSLVDSMRSDITILAAQLQRATKRPNTNKTRRSSGRLNIDRYSKIDVCQTTRFFDKRRVPGKNDIAVYVNVDESGSMCGSRTTQARLACIAIAEACAKVNIPLYVMGFTADIGHYDAYHLHYVRWKNTQKERYALMDISARDDNFDGYSIRYASRLLLKRPEASKLLVVISDGQPAAMAYGRSYSNVGILDTSEAIRQATADGIVVHGIAIGGRDTSVLRNMYGTNFTSNTDLSMLFRDFGNAILRQLNKEW